jgi:hypothetical protein
VVGLNSLTVEDVKVLKTLAEKVYERKAPQKVGVTTLPLKKEEAQVTQKADEDPVISTNSSTGRFGTIISLDGVDRGLHTQIAPQSRVKLLKPLSADVYRARTADGIEFNVDINYIDLE